MTKAIIYTRFSPRPNDDCDSCEKQWDRCYAYCVEKDYDNEHIQDFSDRFVSGGDLNRPGLEQAINELQEGDVLVVDRTDRLARDMLVGLTIRARIQAKGARIEFADGSPSDTTAEGRLFQAILLAFAEYERERIRERTRAGLARKKAEGKHLGRVPYGCRRDGDGSLVPEERERVIMDFVCACKRNHMAPAYIVNQVNALYGGIRGKQCTERTVRTILSTCRET